MKQKLLVFRGKHPDQTATCTFIAELGFPEPMDSGSRKPDQILFCPFPLLHYAEIGSRDLGFGIFALPREGRFPRGRIERRLTTLLPT